MTLNVQGLGEKLKRSKLYRIINEEKIDIACLQETHATLSKHRIWKNECGRKILFSDGDTRSRGVAIVLSDRVSYIENSLERDNLGRWLSIAVRVGELRFRVINVYGPNEDDPEFYALLLEKVVNYEEDHVFIAGDLNVNLTLLDKKGGAFPNSKSREIINCFLEDMDWVDTWRTFHREEFQYTWKRRHPLIFSRLDYILAPLGSHNIFNSCEILPSIISDHCPVVLKINVGNNMKGPGYWKLNSRILTNLDVVEDINKVLDLANYRYSELNPSNRWEMVKLDVREAAISASRRKASERYREIERLRHRLKGLKKKLAMVNLIATNAVQLIQTTNDRIDEITVLLNKHMNYAAQGAMLRAKA